MTLRSVTERRGTPLSESELLSQARRGIATALAALYEAHAGELLRIGARITGNKSDAEDLLHDLFVGLPELLGRYEHRARLDAWLRGIMIRMAIGRLRLDTRRAKANALEAHRSTAMRADPWSAMDLENAIAALPEGMRVVFVLRQIEGHSHDEIASLLGISSGAARVRYTRALRQLRAFLEPRK
ncbi:MAG: RNA polymerase sigma factor [bacterium]